jgi:hypothetical protein
MNNAIDNIIEVDLDESIRTDWVYQFVCDVFYLSWVTCPAYQTGNMAKGQIKWKVGSAIRHFAERENIDVTYKGWLEWMKINHNNSFPHILG